MTLNSLFSSILAGVCAVLISGTAWAEGSGSGTVNDAFQVAKQAVNPAVQDKVVSLYGIGTPAAIQKWYIIFYDPTVPTHGRVVLVQNDQIVKTYDANGGKTYLAELSFDPAKISSEAPALYAAQGFAARHSIAYDSVKALLRQTGKNKPFRWQIELVDVGASKGFVYVNALDDTVAAFSSPSEGKTSVDSASKTASGFGNDVKHTFLGIGGDLQEFFTGERTVDK